MNILGIIVIGICFMVGISLFPTILGDFFDEVKSILNK